MHEAEMNDLITVLGIAGGLVLLAFYTRASHTRLGKRFLAFFKRSEKTNIKEETAIEIMLSNMTDIVYGKTEEDQEDR